MDAFFVSLMFLLAVTGEQPPTFEDYVVKEKFKGVPAKVDLQSHPGARRFRTRLREGAAKGPNFTGHYTVIMWGCGTSCQELAIVDAKNGRVYSPLGFLTSEGACWRDDSSLLITDPIGPDVVDLYNGTIPNWLKTRYFRWDGIKLLEIISTRAVMERLCAPEYGW